MPMTDPCKTSALSKQVMEMACALSVRYVLDGARARLIWASSFPGATLSPDMGLLLPRGGSFA